MIKSYNTLAAEVSNRKHGIVVVLTLVGFSALAVTSLSFAFRFQIKSFADTIIRQVTPEKSSQTSDTEQKKVDPATQNTSRGVNVSLGKIITVPGSSDLADSASGSGNTAGTETGGSTDTSDEGDNSSDNGSTDGGSTDPGSGDTGGGSSDNGGSTGGGSGSSGGGGSSASCSTNSVWQSLESCGWPGLSNTGPSGSLTSMSNGMTINSSGTYTNLDIHKYLNINASNVTVKNFKLSDINAGYTALRIDPSATNVVLEDCEINPNFVTYYAIWAYDNITVRRCDIYKAGVAIQARHNLNFEENYCHDIDDVSNDGEDWHTNCVIAVNASNGVSGWHIYHNTMRLGTPGGLKYFSGVINTLLAANNTIENNLMANGSYVMYLFDSRYASVVPTNTYVKNNKFSNVDSSSIGIYGIWYKGQGWSSYSPHVSFTGNIVLETNKDVNGTEP